MKVNIRGDKLEVTSAIKEYAINKINHLNKYFENADEIEAKVLVRAKNNYDYVEVTIPISKLILRAEEKEKDLYAAIDLVVDKLENQIRKNKSKIKDKYKQQPSFEMSLDFESDDIEEYDIIKRKDVEDKPMDEEEALLQMKLLNHDFFVFRNTDEECVSVLYKRKDDKYGIINIK